MRVSCVLDGQPGKYAGSARGAAAGLLGLRQARPAAAYSPRLRLDRELLARLLLPLLLALALPLPALLLLLPALARLLACGPWRPLLLLRLLALLRVLARSARPPVLALRAAGFSAGCLRRLPDLDEVEEELRDAIETLL